MRLAHVPHSHADSQMNTAAVLCLPPVKQRRPHRRALETFYADPRFVDEIGVKVYKYHPALRVAVFLGLSLGLWLLLFMASSALLSAV